MPYLKNRDRDREGEFYKEDEQGGEKKTNTPLPQTESFHEWVPHFKVLVLSDELLSWLVIEGMFSFGVDRPVVLVHGLGQHLLSYKCISENSE